MNEFIDEMYKVFAITGVCSIYNAKLPSYQFKDVAQIWYVEWKYSRPIGAGSIEWENFNLEFIDKFFLRELREANL